MLSHDALQVSTAQGCSGVRSLRAVYSDAGQEGDAQPAQVKMISAHSAQQQKMSVKQHVMTRQVSHMQTQQHWHSMLIHKRGTRTKTRVRVYLTNQSFPIITNQIQITARWRL